MILSKAQLEEFESGLEPTALAQSTIPAEVIGYGEISTVFQIQGMIKMLIKDFRFLTIVK